MCLENAVLGRQALPCCFPMGSHTSDHSLVLLLGVLEEAEFYNIASLVRLVKERIRDNENRTSQVRCLELLRTKPVQAAVCLCCDKDGCLLLGAGELDWFRVGIEERSKQSSPSPSGECYSSAVAVGRPQATSGPMFVLKLVAHPGLVTGELCNRRRSLLPRTLESSKRGKRLSLLCVRMAIATCLAAQWWVFPLKKKQSVLLSHSS